MFVTDSIATQAGNKMGALEVHAVSIANELAAAIRLQLVERDDAWRYET